MTRTDIYSDLDLTLGLTIRSDFAKVLDVNAIKQSVKNIVMTRNKLFKPRFGPRISQALFDLDNPFNRELIKDEIKLSLKKWEKRVNQVDVEFSGSIDVNEMICTISFQIINTIGRYEVSVILEKIR